MRKARVVLDPGHGGTERALDSSPNRTKSANGLDEKDVVLAVALEAARRMQASGRSVRLTRSDDRNLGLAERAAVARESGAEVFVSLHLNGDRSSATHGAEAYVSPSNRPKDRALAGALLQALRQTAASPSRGTFVEDLRVLRGEHHVEATAACLLELDYLTHGPTAEHLAQADGVVRLAEGLSSGIEAFLSRGTAARGLEDNASQNGERKIYSRRGGSPGNAEAPGFSIPQPGVGEDRHEFEVPKGLRFSRWEVEVTSTSLGGGYGVEHAPERGSTGKLSCNLKWSHPPFGNFQYELRAYASPDATSEPVPVVVDGPGWVEVLRDQVNQGTPVALTLRGQKAKMLADAIQARKADGDSSLAVAQLTGAEEVALILGIAALVVIVIGLGMLFATFAAIMITAMHKGYDIKDSSLKASVGEGTSRQEYELGFVLAPPEN